MGADNSCYLACDVFQEPKIQDYDARDRKMRAKSKKVCLNQKECNNSPFVTNRSVYIQSLSKETKTYMAATHLFVTIWDNYFRDNENKCEYINNNNDDDKNDETDLDLLQYLYIRGGTCRDIILNKPISEV